MADYEARIAPFINTLFYVTSAWWEQPRNHRGLDISTGANDNLYSMCNGTVIRSGWSSGGYGYMIILEDSTTHMGFLYAHMKEASPLQVGDSVTIGQFVGIEGSTGDSTGIHLHIEMQDLTNHPWQYGAPKEVYTNPADWMGFPNVEGISVIYNGTPIPALSWIARSTALTQAEMENNAYIIISYYQSLGINDYTIAAILGNMQAESTINPELEEVGGQGYGLVQWTPVSVLQDHCNALNLTPYTSGDVQIQVIIKEILGDPASILEWYSSQAFISNYYNSGATADMIGITGQDFLENSMNWSADKLAVLFMAAYERPSYDPTINHYALRQQYSLFWYNFIRTHPTPPTPGARKNLLKWLMAKSKKISIKN